MIKSCIKLGENPYTESKGTEIPSITLQYSIKENKRDITNIFGFYADMSKTIKDDFHSFDFDYSTKEIHIYLSNNFDLERDSYALIDLFYYLSYHITSMDWSVNRIRVAIPITLKKKIYNPLLKKVKSYISTYFLFKDNSKELNKDIFNIFKESILIMNKNLVIHNEIDINGVPTDVCFISYNEYADGTDVYKVMRRSIEDKNKMDTLLSYVLVGRNPFRLQDKGIYNQNTILDFNYLEKITVIYAIESFMDLYKQLEGNDFNFFEKNILINYPKLMLDDLFENVNETKEPYIENLFGHYNDYDDSALSDIWREIRLIDGEIGLDCEELSIKGKCKECLEKYEELCNYLCNRHICLSLDEDNTFQSNKINVNVKIFTLWDWDSAHLQDIEISEEEREKHLKNCFAECKISLDIFNSKDWLFHLVELLKRFDGCTRTPERYIPNSGKWKPVTK